MYDCFFSPRYMKVIKSLPVMSSDISRNSTLSTEICSPFTITQEISSGIQLQMSSSISILCNVHRLVSSISNFVTFTIRSCFPQGLKGFSSSCKRWINQIHYIVRHISFDLVSGNNQFDLFHASKLFQVF